MVFSCAVTGRPSGRPGLLMLVVVARLPSARVSGRHLVSVNAPPDQTARERDSGRDKSPRGALRGD
jgi:hypothetical protein